MHQEFYYPKYPYASNNYHKGLGQILVPDMINDFELDDKIIQLVGDAAINEITDLGFVHKKIKKQAKRIAKAVKKALPVVVTAVAMFYTGGKAAPFIKKYSGKIGKKWGTWKEVMGKYLDKPPPIKPASSIQDPRITQASVAITRQQLLNQGININSTKGKQMLAQYSRYQQAGMQGASQRPTNWGKILVPAAAGGAAIFMFTR